MSYPRRPNERARQGVQVQHRRRRYQPQQPQEAAIDASALVGARQALRDRHGAPSASGSVPDDGTIGEARETLAEVRKLGAEIDAWLRERGRA